MSLCFASTLSSMSKRNRFLRRIVAEYTNADGLPRERLECGHEVPPKQDIYGYTNATRRECWRCQKEAENA